MHIAKLFHRKGKERNIFSWISLSQNLNILSSNVPNKLMQKEFITFSVIILTYLTFSLLLQNLCCSLKGVVNIIYWILISNVYTGQELDQNE